MKNCETRRIPAADYHELCKKVIADIGEITPGLRPVVIPSYRTKEDFGDMDVLVYSEHMSSGFLDKICEKWKSKERVSNGGCHSLELNGFQIDIITAPADEFRFALAYFSWNDLGNLMGRVAHKMGLKFGHDGLYYALRDGTNHLEEVQIITHPDVAISWLGFNLERWYKGFDTLEEIFEFVAANPYFNPDIYLFDNMNAVSRIRDKKRKTYNAFLAWCETYKEQNPDRVYYSFPAKSSWLPKLREEFPVFDILLTRAHQDQAWRDYLKTKFNGRMIQEATGLEGEELGRFIQQVYRAIGGKGSTQATNWIIDTTPQDKADFVRAQLSIFKSSLV